MNLVRNNRIGVKIYIECSKCDSAFGTFKEAEMSHGYISTSFSNQDYLYDIPDDWEQVIHSDEYSYVKEAELICPNCKDKT